MTPCSAAAGGICASRSELARRLLVDLFGHLGGLDAISQLIRFGVPLVSLAELASDRLELLAQQVLPLRLAHVALDLLPNLTFDLAGLARARHLGQHVSQTRGDVRLLEQGLLRRDVDVEVVGHEICQLRRVVEVAGQHLELVGEPRVLRHERVELLGDVAAHRLHLDRGPIAGLFDGLYARAKEGLLLREFLDAGAGYALKQDAVGVIRELVHPHDPHDRTHAVDVVRAGAGLARLLHRDREENPIWRHQHVIDEPLRTRRVHQQRREQEGEERRVLERLDRQVFR
jgi:hypothetical protein